MNDIKEFEEKLIHNQDLLREAIQASKEVIPDYYQTHMAMHIRGAEADVAPAGSWWSWGDPLRTPRTLEEVENVLLSQLWEIETPDGAMPGCTYLHAVGSGRMMFGVECVGKLSTMEDSTVDVVPVHGDPEHLELRAQVRSSKDLPWTREAWIIIGPEQGRDVIYTAFPGRLIPPSNITRDDIAPGTYDGKDLIEKLGPDRWVKLVPRH